MVTALTAIGALIFTGLSLNATRDQVAAAHRQNEVAQQGQYTDRYTKAVEQLDQAGPEHLQTRLGGIYALQRLAVDSPRDHPTITNVLVTFITSTIQRAAGPAGPGSGCPPSTAPDIQVALTAFFERNRSHDAGTTPDRGIPLEAACLAHVKAVSAHLTDANLIAANLNEADLRQADLRQANLGTARLASANLSNADLRDAFLYGAFLYGAKLNYADLRGVDLHGADLRGADLREADLRWANLSHADLRGARLGGIQHEGTNIDKAITDSTTTGKWW
ncbi:hypothetical protein BS329_41610 [Amycolatopsis coloradensis]|uniref:Pentapeptide repeat-containing protein n=1 Tax=Amycolatopsis coloradensis TaxID=76021 RepID=A0A1R0KCZ7_9PSEU|nr:hypothetical protein BS329_41610 [Amycolatopsis coloradensis]